MFSKLFFTGVVVRPEVSSLRVMGSTPTQCTGLSILSRYVGSRLKPTVAQGLVDTVGEWKHGPAYPA
jgi:hypothetical protein